MYAGELDNRMGIDKRKQVPMEAEVDEACDEGDEGNNNNNNNNNNKENRGDDSNNELN
jgi:hypothetical protein